MINFYSDMRVGVLYLSSQTKSYVLSEMDIKNLPQYKNADDKYKDDFDNSVLSPLSMGSISMGQVKTKSLKSPFASNSTFNAPTQEMIYYDLKPEIQDNTSPKETIQHSYYEPKNPDDIDALVA